MSDSGASSPLSSASSSRAQSLTGPSTPSGADKARAGDEPTSLKSDRSRRSPTSSTVPFSEVSELTEEEEEDEEEKETVDADGATENGNEDDLEDEDDEPLSDVEGDEDEVPVRRRNASQSVTSPSLTPPPSSELVQTKALPRSEGSPTPSGDKGDDDAEEPNGDDGDAASEQAAPEEEEEVEEDAEDGDVTMRPADDGDDDDEEEEPGDEVKVAENGEEAEEADGDAQVDEEQEETVEEQVDGEEGMDEEAAEEDGEMEAAETASLARAPARSSHAPPPSAAHMKSLLVLELKFAALRDKLYLERMEEAAAEEEMVLNGSHPALTHLHKILSERREKLHEVATQRHKAALEELVRAREASKAHVWSWWTEERDRMHWDEFETTWSKRRRLAREKNEIETPRIVKPIPRVGDRSTRPFDWSAGATPGKMSNEEAAHDLALMETRRVQPMQGMMQSHHPSRHMSPAMYGPAQNQNANDASRQMTSTQPQPNYAYNQVHQAFNPPRTATSQPQPQMPPGSVSGPSRTASQPQPSQQPQQPQPAPQPRREGRTVPTTSDMFDGRKEGYISPASSLSWPKPEHRTNGHNGVSQKETAPVKQEDRRFPGLAEYLGGKSGSGGPSPPVGHSSAPGHSGYGPSAKVLSPPSIGASSVLAGTFGPRPSIPAAQPTGTTAAGGSGGR